MKRGTLHHFRRRRILRLILGVLSILVLVLGLAARADEAAGACAEGEACAGQPIDRDFVIRLVGPPQGTPLEGEALAAKTHEVSLLLRCPTCQGSSVADSPSSTALNMRREVEDLLALGFTEDQVLAYFEAAYGQFVLLRPKAEGLNLLVWIGPGILLLLGAGILVVYLRRGEEEPEAEEVAAPPTTAPADDDDLEPWVLRVRELAYGWPGGVPPEEERS